MFVNFNRRRRNALVLGVCLCALAAPAGAMSVREVQQALTTRGYPVGAADGLMGPRTARAIRAFEADQGWEPSGVMSGRLERALQPPRDLPLIVLRPPPSVQARQPATLQPAESEPPAFANRNWTVRDEREDGTARGPVFALFLEADGKVAGPRFARHMRWRQQADRVVIRYESPIGATVERTGRALDADRIVGEAHGPDGAFWRWTAEARPVAP